MENEQKIDLDLLKAWELYQRKGWTEGNVSLAEALILAKLRREERLDLMDNVVKQLEILKTKSHKEIKRMIKEKQCKKNR